MAIKVRMTVDESEIEDILTEYFDAFDSMLQIFDRHDQNGKTDKR